MKIDLSIETPNKLKLVWEIGSDDMLALSDCLVDAYGVPAITRDGEPYDIRERVRVRMGEVGTPRREITIEPVPEKAPEPISVPSEPEKVPA